MGESAMYKGHNSNLTHLQITSLFVYFACPEHISKTNQWNFWILHKLVKDLEWECSVKEP